MLTGVTADHFSSDAGTVKRRGKANNVTALLIAKGGVDSGFYRFGTRHLEGKARQLLARHNLR